MVYVGAVCDSEFFATGDDLSGFVLKIDLANINNGFTLEAEVDLSYTRGSYGPSAVTTWRGWTNLADATGFYNPRQPILSNIEFDTDGSLVLGFIDRGGLQLGHQNYNRPTCSNMTLEDYSANGDIRRLCYVDCTYLQDSETGCTTTNNVVIPGTTEYYWGEHGPFSGGTSEFPEIAIGGLALLPGTNQLITNAFDPNGFYEGGVVTLDNTTGADINRYTVYESTSGPSSTFGKSVGLGEPEVLCDPAPLEIGNYVWCDSIANGIQDACERGIDEVLVQLFDNAGLLVGQDTTSNGGLYYFNEFNVDAAGVTVDANGIATPVSGWTGLDYQNQYFIVFGDGQFGGGELTVGGEAYPGITAANTGNNDNIDSDVDGNILTSGSVGAIPNGLPFIDVLTSSTGCGDHKYDLGLVCGCPIENCYSISVIRN